MVAELALAGERKRSGARDPAYGVAAVERAIDVLEAFSRRKPELGLAEIAVRTGLHKATAFRMLATLCRRGLVTKHPQSGLYRLGFALLPMAEIAKSDTGLLAEALPLMRILRDRLNETVFLSVRAGDHRIDVEQVEGLQDVRRVLKLGEPKLLHAGCASKVLLASLNDTDIASYLERHDLVTYTPQTIVDRTRLLQEIARIRRRGYAESWDERRSGGAGAAAAIFGADGAAIGTITVSVPVNRYSQALRKLVVAGVQETARAVTTRFGARGSLSEQRRHR